MLTLDTVLWSVISIYLDEGVTKPQLTLESTNFERRIQESVLVMGFLRDVKAC